MCDSILARLSAVTCLHTTLVCVDYTEDAFLFQQNIKAKTERSEGHWAEDDSESISPAVNCWDDVCMGAVRMQNVETANI